MSKPPYKPTESQLPTGQVIDLAAPDPERIDLIGLIEMISKQVRWGGATPNTAFSIGQHCVNGASLWASTLPPRIRMLILLHDLHEFCGDITDPVQEAAGIRTQWRLFTDRVDTAIYHAVGIDPPTPEERAIIATIDKALAHLEFNDLMHPDLEPLVPVDQLPPRSRILKAHHWPTVMAMYLNLFRQLATELNLRGTATVRILDGN